MRIRSNCNAHRIFGVRFFFVRTNLRRKKERKTNMEKRLFTSECVTNGHPDKVADSISDAILDACLAQDPGSRVACETMVTTDFCLICGEITTKAKVDYDAVAREAIRAIGYTREGDGFNADTVEIQCRIHTQSADIALGTNDEVGGAGDQANSWRMASGPEWTAKCLAQAAAFITLPSPWSPFTKETPNSFVR